MFEKIFTQYPQIIAGTTYAEFGDGSKHSPRDMKNRPVAYNHLLNLTRISQIYLPNSQHTNVVLHVPQDDLSQASDALITMQKNSLLVVPTADCIPVFIYDPVKSAIAMIHSGRIGLRDHITENTIKKMQEHFFPILWIYLFI